MLNIVLVEPRIPQNTGNIGRLCVGSNSVLHLIEPLGFVINDRNLKRAGMDYWEKLQVHTYPNLEAFWQTHPFSDRHFLATTKTTTNYLDKSYQMGDYLYFGREDKGLGEQIINAHLEQCITIKMRGDVRSINLANSVAIVLYEALRQDDGKSTI